LAIAGLLAVLVVSYCQVIAVHPGGGGAYAVGKKDLGATVSLLAAASLVVDYVLTVAVSLAAGAASLASAFPSLAHDLLAMCLTGLVLITAVNLWGIAERARPHAADDGVPGRDLRRHHRRPAPRAPGRGRRYLGALLGAMLIGLSVLIRREHVAPRGGVTVLAQLTAGSFGTGWAYYATNIAVTLVLALAANTSFGGLPVLTATAAAVFIVSKFTSGAWVVVLLPHRPPPAKRPSIARTARWCNPIVDYVRQAQQGGRQVAVLIIEIQPRRWRYRILQNQRELLLATVLRASTDVVICTIPYRLTTR
jgi:hypothetical protein